MVSLRPRLALAFAAIAGVSAFAPSTWSANAQPSDRDRHPVPPVEDRPRFVLDVGLGGARYSEALGADFGVGVAYRARIGFQLDSILGIDVGAFGARHEASPGESAIATTFDASLRLSLPIPVVRPFVTAGMGAGRVALRDDVAGVYRLAPHYALEVPIAAGVEIKLGREIGLQVVANQAFMFAGGLGDAKLGRTALAGLMAGARVYF